MLDTAAAPTRSSDTGGRLASVVVGQGMAEGLAAVGIAPAEELSEARRHLVERRRRGLHAGMQFTYRNPDRSTDPQRILPGARSLVVGAWGYERERPGPAEPAPAPGHASSARPTGSVARYSHRDHYGPLRRTLHSMAETLVAHGWRATVVCDDNALVDRAAAHRAGLGWFGKNTLLLLPGLGSWFLLGCVVTDAPLWEVDKPTAAPMEHGSGCGRCTRCRDACPTGALDEPGVLDARRCLAWLLQAPGPIPPEFREALGRRVYGCDACQQACPINQVAGRRHPPPPAEADGDGEVDLLALLEMDDGEIVARFGRFYIPGREARYLRRNALVALGNVGDGSDPATVTALRRALGHPDPLIVEHASWAARRLGRDDLARRGT